MHADSDVRRGDVGTSCGQGFAAVARARRPSARFGAGLGLAAGALGLAAAVLLLQPERAPSTAGPATGRAAVVGARPIATVKDAWFLESGSGTAAARPLSGPAARDAWYLEASEPARGLSADSVGRDSWYLETAGGLAAASGVATSSAGRDRWFEGPKPATDNVSAARDRWFLTR